MVHSGNGNVYYDKGDLLLIFLAAKSCVHKF